MNAANNPLGISEDAPTNLDVNLRELAARIETSYPRLWRMLKKHPLEGGLHVLSASAYTKKFGVDPRVGHSSSATHDALDNSITLNGGALTEITASNAFGTWVDGVVRHKTEEDKIYAGASYNQGLDQKDFYLIVTMHELGHHFAQWARKINVLGNAVGVAFIMAMISNRAVSGYAVSDIEEYWAESFSAYWYMPDALKKVDEAAYLSVEYFTKFTLKRRKANDQPVSDAA